MKIYKKVLALLLLGILLTGCTKDNKNDNQSNTEALVNNVQNKEIAGWKIEVQDAQREKKLEDISVVLGYSDVGTKEFSKEANEGYEFFLVKMKFEKIDGKEKIVWDNLTLKDQDGNTFNRIEDAFLTDLNMSRLHGTELNFGTNEGWIAFEIKDSSTNLVMDYQFENDVFTYEFN